ncbi:MAG TPA: PQQ-dependent sugar dehydrogenase [Alphaproteobacteria bacterium]|nr:PQQ-dependent sugar dehydrogenase [Alphaproteobacteria bacterium]
MRVVRCVATLGGAAGLLWLSAVQAQVGQTPGERFTVRPADLPAPYATPSASNPPRRVARPDGVGLNVPPGFASNVFADGLTHPRWLAVAPNGDVLLAESAIGRITLLRDADGDGRAETVATFLEGLSRPHGMAFGRDGLYVADVNGVFRIPYQPGDIRARGEPRPITEPGALGPGSGHWTRNIVFNRAGDKLYVAVGSRSNIGEEDEIRAAMLEFGADGGGRRVYAGGLRNPVGIAFRPGTDELWAVVNERDGLGDGLVPDYLTQVIAGEFYGWPYAYIGRNPQPGFAERRPDLVQRTRVPDLLFQSHSAPIGLVFYSGESFPEEFRGNAFVALRGSWNSGQPTGYKVVRVPFRNGRPVGHYENFATGFWIAGEDTARVWGRPAGLAVARDGALLIADDTGQSVWRVAWRGR